MQARKRPGRCAEGRGIAFQPKVSERGTKTSTPSNQFLLSEIAGGGPRGQAIYASMKNFWMAAHVNQHIVERQHGPIDPNRVVLIDLDWPPPIFLCQDVELNGHGARGCPA